MQGCADVVILWEGLKIMEGRTLQASLEAG